jgi:mannosyltransferase OCH1-like enzyme
LASWTIGSKDPVVSALDPPRRVLASKREAKTGAIGWTFPKSFEVSTESSDRSSVTFVPVDERIQNLQSTLEAAILASERRVWIPHTNEVPLIIHQTWKTYNVSSEPKHVRDSLSSWKSQNPEAVHLLWNDKDIDALARQFFPAFGSVYNKIQKPILKADIFRYMVLSVFGGVYADTDTECTRPVLDWIYPSDLEGSMNTDISFIIGVEADVYKEFGDKWMGIYPHPLQMCQWTMAARAGILFLGSMNAT